MTTDHPTRTRPPRSLEEAGFKVQVRTRPDPDERRPRQRPVAGRGHAPLLGRDGDDLPRLRCRRAAADPDPDPDAMRVAVLAGGRSSEHDVSLNSAAAVREGIAAAGHEVLPVTIERSGAWIARGRGAGAAPERRPARRRRRLPGPARPVRRGRHGPGPARAARRALRRRGRARLLAVHGQDRLQGGPGGGGRPAGRLRRRAARPLAGRARGRAARARGARARRSSSSRRGSAPRSGSPRSWSEAELGPALDARVRPRQPGDRRGLLGRHRGRVRRARQRRARGAPSRARSSSPAPIGTTTRPSTPPAAWSSSSPPGCRDAVLDEVRRLACDTFVRVGCAGLARVDFFVEDGERVLVNELNTLPGFTATSVFPKLWEASGVSFPDLCDRLLALALERFAANAPSLSKRCLRGQAPLRIFRRRLPGRAGSRRSRRGRRRRRAS